MAETLRFGVAEPASVSNASKKENEPIAAGVAVKDPVYWDGSIWKKATPVTISPTGVVESVASGTGTVILRGQLVTTGLTAGAFYFVADAGGITTTQTSVFVGQALSATALLVSFNPEHSISTRVGSVSYITRGNSDANTNVIQRMNLTNDTIVVNATGFVTRAFPGGNTGSVDHPGAGYVGDGLGGAPSASLQKIEYATTLTSFLTAILPFLTQTPAAYNDDSRHVGYYESGIASSFDTQKLDFATEGVSVIAATTAADLLGAGISSLEAGYRVGRASGTTIYKFLFSNEKSSLLVATASLNLATVGSSAEDVTLNQAGYAASVGNNTTSNKLSFVTEISTVLTHAIGSARNSFFNSLSSAYSAGGFTGAVNTNTIAKMPFATEAFGVLGITLVAVHRDAGSVND